MSTAYSKAQAAAAPPSSRMAPAPRPAEQPNPLGRGLFLITLILVAAGVVMVFDASYPLAIEIYKNPWFFAGKQILWAVAGLGGLFAARRIPYWKWRALALPALACSILLLLLVHVPGIGHSAGGSTRWVGYGPVRVQPSEFAKLSLILFVATVLAAKPNLTRNLWGGVVPLIGVALVDIALVDKQPDLGTAITMLLTVLFILYTGGAKARWLATVLAVLAAASVALMFRPSKAASSSSGDAASGAAAPAGGSYRWRRVTAFMNPEAYADREAYQVIHSTIALGTGGWGGLGFGESREKRRGGLPAQRTDMIFAITGEEFGLAGTSGLIVLYILLAGCGFTIAQRARDAFGALLATGITGMIAVQSLINIAVVTASIPTTGVPLPFISYGGSSLAVTMFAIGILWNVSDHPFRKPEAKNRRTKPAPDPYTSLAPPPPQGRSASLARERLMREHETDSNERERALR